MKKISIILLCNFFFFSTLLGQAATATWPLTSSQGITIVGNVTATNQALIGMQASYSNSVQRSSPSGTAGTWSNTSESSSIYMQFAISPVAGNSLTISSLSMILYSSAGSGMRANVYYSTDSTFGTKTQVGGATYTLGNSTLSSANVTASPSITVNSGSTLYVRIYPWYTSSTTTKYLITNNVVISGTTQSMVAVIPSISELTGFTQAGSSTPSSTQSYTVTGNNLTNNVVITPPAHFQISTDGGSTWIDSTSSITLSVSSGSIVGQPVNVSVRLNASSSGVYSGTIIHASAGASSANVAVSGVVLALEPTTASTVSFGTVVNGSSLVVNCAGGNGSNRIVVVRAGNAVNWIPTDGTPINGISANFSSAADQGNGNKVVYDGTGTSVTMTGLSSNVTYYVAVYEYNTAGSGAQNFLTASAGTGSQTTLAVSTLTVSKGSIVFGNVAVNTTSSEASYTLSGVYFTSTTGNITVSAPSGFEVSTTSGSGFASSLMIPYTANTLSTTTIYVHSIPKTIASYSDSIINSGGGAPTVKIAVSSNGVSELVATNTPVGYASCGSGTTGGVGGDTIVITDSGTLNTLLTARQKNITTPVVYMISGTLTSPGNEIDIKRTSNVSILGIDNNAVINGFGFKMTDASNIIIRNLKFTDCTAGEGDAISVESSSNVWIDHNSFTDAPGDSSNEAHDGQTDVKKGSNNVTISYNHYQHHRKTCLLGYSASDNSDVASGVTYYRNWFQGTYSRHPRVRYAHPHILNNYFQETGMWAADSGGYAIGATCGCLIYSEANYFEHVRTPFLISMFNDPSGVLSHDPIGFIRSTGDYFVNCSGIITTHDTTTMILPSSSYTYTAEDPLTVKATVMANAGSGILNITAPTVTSVTLPSGTPKTLTLKQNYPNPFNPSTVIGYQLAQNGVVSLKVYDLLGREMTTLANGYQTAGDHAVTFDASRFSSGLYFYQLQTSTHIETKKMLLLK
jgi:pectate lyase